MNPYREPLRAKSRLSRLRRPAHMRKRRTWWPCSMKVSASPMASSTSSDARVETRPRGSATRAGSLVDDPRGDAAGQQLRGEDQTGRSCTDDQHLATGVCDVFMAATVDARPAGRHPKNYVATTYLAPAGPPRAPMRPAVCGSGSPSFDRMWSTCASTVRMERYSRRRSRGWSGRVPPVRRPPTRAGSERHDGPARRACSRRSSSPRRVPHRAAAGARHREASPRRRRRDVNRFQPLVEVGPDRLGTDGVIDAFVLCGGTGQHQGSARPAFLRGEPGQGAEAGWDGEAIADVHDGGYALGQRCPGACAGRPSRGGRHREVAGRARRRSGRSSAADRSAQRSNRSAARST